MAHWNSDQLMHSWYGGTTEDVVATWNPAPDAEGRGAVVYDSIDRTKRFRFYDKPTADEAFSRILQYQGGY